MKKIVLLALSLSASPSLALAHAVFADGQAVAGASFKAALGIPHGCGALATREIRIEIPDGFHDAKPMPKAGWTLDVIAGPSSAGDGPAEIRWTGGTLEDAWYDEFIVRGTFDPSLVGQAVAFPATQVCDGGESVVWDAIAAPGEDPHSLEHPAPTIQVTAGGGGEAHHHAAAASEAPGGLTVADGFARAMLPNAPTGGGYLTLRNGGAEADRLLAASSPRAGRVELHEMSMAGEIMRMRALPEGAAIPAGGTLALAPGGLHLMFLEVDGPFTEGEEVPVTLKFEKAGTIETVLRVGAPNAASALGDAASTDAAHNH